MFERWDVLVRRHLELSDSRLLDMALALATEPSVVALLLAYRKHLSKPYQKESHTSVGLHAINAMQMLATGRDDERLTAKLILVESGTHLTLEYIQSLSQEDQETYLEGGIICCDQAIELAAGFGMTALGARCESAKGLLLYAKRDFVAARTALEKAVMAYSSLPQDNREVGGVIDHQKASFSEHHADSLRSFNLRYSR